jgi:sulfite exporter TauE/SafE
MLALFVSVFAASLLGSFHCAGMCGAFVALACGATETDRTRQATLQFAYHGGRLLTYTTLGLAAGAAGHLIDLTGALAGIKSAAAVLAAGTMLLFAVVALLRARGNNLPRLPLPAGWMRLIQDAHRLAMNRPPVARATLIGVLTTLLPCGWLYAFVVTAAGVGKPWISAGVMAAFWVGTLPVLVGIGIGARGLLGRAGKHLPTVTALAVAAVAVYVLVGRTHLDPAALAAAVEPQSTHAAPAVPAAEDVPACCREKPQP